MKTETKQYSELFGYRSPRHHHKSIYSGLKSPRGVLSNINGSDKESISGRSRRSRTRQG